MRKTILALFVMTILISMLSIGGFGQNADTADVKAAQEALWQAETNRDTATVLGYLTDDFITTHSVHDHRKTKSDGLGKKPCS